MANLPPSSINWIRPKMPTLEELCQIKLLWKRVVHPDAAENRMVKSVEILKGLYDQMSPFERFTCGHYILTYAAFDSAVDEANSMHQNKECADFIISGMHSYAIAMGESSVYIKYVNIHNVLSSIAYFTTVPSLNYYLSVDDRNNALERIIPGKEDCLQAACDLIRSTQDASLDTDTLLLKQRLQWCAGCGCINRFRVQKTSWEIPESGTSEASPSETVSDARGRMGVFQTKK